jgi:VanZ family protein
MRIVTSFWRSILWAVIVVSLSTMSGKKVSELPFMGIPHIDKVAHFGMYFVLSFLLLFDFSRYKFKNMAWKKVIIISVIMAIAFGGSMELLQEVPSLERSTDIKDFIANSTGALCAVFFYKYLLSLLNKITDLFTKPKRSYSL